ncbi:TPA: hypothetical protein HA265_05100, partial [Candidatus Woesearchaeota archaeon]|nr:hypothetical protein [Candidatus Woesearchaeota archaeon]
MEQTVKRNMKRTARRIVIVAVILFFAIVTLTTVTPQDYLNDPTLGVVETPHDEYNAVQLPAETGEPVEWVKQVTVTNLYDQAITEVMVSVPQQAGEI